MKYLEVVAHERSIATLSGVAAKRKAHDVRPGPVGADGMQTTRILIGDDHLQGMLDDLQNVLGAQPTARIVVLPVEAALPMSDEEMRMEENRATAAREMLYQDVEKSARLDSNFLLLVALSTTVAAIGLIKNNVAVVVGAMVIAPLLGPNLALSLGTALGDLILMRKSIWTLLAGIILAVGLSAVVGLVWPGSLNSVELLSRTEVGLDSIGLALASGAAAALSMSTGLSTVLVGVMVAVALLPPATALGLMLGHGEVGLAAGAGLLLAVNVVCVNLASKLVFVAKGVSPRTWYEKERARRAVVIYVVVWILTLIVLAAIIFMRGQTL